MATTDFGGLLFGGGDTSLEGYLTPEQQSNIQNQAMLQAAASLLQAGGPSSRRISLGQALGGALQAGSAGYQQAQQGAVQSLLVRQKLAEAKRLEDFRKALQTQQLQPQVGGGGEVTTITPDQAISMEGLPAGPTVARANLIGQQVRAPAPQMSEQDMLYQDAMNKYKIAERYGMSEEASKYLEKAQKIKPMEKVTGAPFEVTDATSGKPIMVQQFDTGRLQTVTGYGPKRDIVLQELGGKVVAVDKSKLTGTETYAKTLAPQVVGEKEGGYYVFGGGGGVGGVPSAGGGAPRGGAPAGQVVPPAAPVGAPPVAGAPIPIIAGTGVKPPESFYKSALGIQNTNDAINNFTTVLEGFKTSDMFSPEKRAILNSAHSNAMLQAKELYNLGVLTGGDEAILNKVLSNPIDFTNAATPIEAIRKQAEDLQKIVKGANENLARVYKQPEITLNKPLTPPPASTLQEGMTSTSKSGKPIIVRNGQWEYVK